jgi:hypothetical protein
MALTKITGEGVGAVDSITVTNGGSVQSRGGAVTTVIFDPRSNGAGMTGTTNAILPTNQSGAIGDGTAVVDLGASGYRYRDIFLSGNLYLGGTGSANALNDYEEGTWTPTTSSGSFTVSTANYVKIGSLVHCNFNLTVTSTVSAVDFGGLPFSSNAFAGGILGFQNSEAGEVYSIFVQTGTIWNFRVGSVQKGAANSSNLRGSFSFTTDA